jgi:putative Ca2+/H+ antiporter (TMEM165/GDT1 family)
VATTVVHLVSVAVGHFLGVSIPTEAISIVGGLAFVVFGLWTLRGDSLSDDEGAKASRVTKSAFLAIASAFFLAELGDKTMLATVTLAADNDWVGVWIGSTVGMVAADALAIVLGAVLGKHLPERMIQYGAAILFFVFGAVLFFEGLMPGTSAPYVAAAVVVAISALVVAAAFVRRSRSDAPQEVEKRSTTEDV